MENIKLYAILDKKHDVISNVFLSGSDVQAGSWMLKQIKEIYKDVPEQLRNNFIEDVRNTAIVKLGEVSPETKQLTNDYNIIVDLFDFHVVDEETNSQGGVFDEQTKE